MPAPAQILLKNNQNTKGTIALFSFNVIKRNNNGITKVNYPPGIKLSTFLADMNRHFSLDEDQQESFARLVKRAAELALEGKTSPNFPVFEYDLSY